MPDLLPELRFSDRVDSYVKYRPGYPLALLDFLTAECGLSPVQDVADIGAGTGLLTRLFLENGNDVWAVEPDPVMRAAAERDLAAVFPGFHSVAGSAEATTLPEHSTDFWTTGQAFHWFDPVRARAEARRILRPGGWAVLVWNVRSTDTTPFLTAYEQFLSQHGKDYQGGHGGDTTAARAIFFGDTVPKTTTLEGVQHFDAAGLRGRFLSSSYAPAPADPDRKRILAALDHIFEAYQSAGQVAFEYTTEVYAAQLNP